VSESQTPSADASALSEIDQLFAVLDGASVSSEQGQWSSRILGIYADGPYVWVQLSLDRAERPSVIIRVSRPTSVAEITRALEGVRVDADSPTVVRM
jgi:hypothetical protein